MLDESRLALSKELLPGENLFWAGRPKQGFCLQAQDAFLVPFSLVWCGITTVAVSSMLSSGRAFPSIFIPIPHILVGLYLIFGRYVYDAKKRAGTFYGLTDQGVIILSGFFRKSVKRIVLKQISEITLTEHRDSRGTIRFDSGDNMTWYGGRRAGLPPGFERIEDARSVYAKIMEMKRGL